MLERAKEEAGGDDQDQRQRNLRDDESTQELSLTAASRGPALLSQRIDRIGLSGPSCRKGTGDNRRQREDHPGEDKYPPIKRDAQHNGRGCVRQLRHDGFARPPTKRNATGGAHRRQDEALHQRLSRELPARCTQRHAYGALRALRRAARQHQIRNVHASDEKNERDDDDQHH